MAKPRLNETKDRTTAISMFVSAALGVAGLIAGLATAYKTSQVDQRTRTTRVESGWVGSNFLGDDCVNRWVPWQHPVSASTSYVGVRRRIVFRQPFDNTPQITPSLKLVNIRSSVDALYRIVEFKQDSAYPPARLYREPEVLVRIRSKMTEGFPGSFSGPFYQFGKAQGTWWRP